MKKRNQCPTCGKFLSNDVVALRKEIERLDTENKQLRKEIERLDNKNKHMRMCLEQMEAFTYYLVNRNLWQRILNNIDWGVPEPIEKEQ